MVILAMALIPVFGLITGGVMRTDISVSLSGAVELATATMNKLLSESLPFDAIPVTPAGGYRQESGSVAGATTLDPVFEESGWTVTGNGRSRTKDGITYKVQLWSGEALRDSDITFRYLASPQIQTENGGGRFDWLLAMGAGDWDFCPYNPTGSNRVTGTPAWASQEVTLNQWDVSAAASSAPHDQNHNIKKLVVRVSWSLRDPGTRGVGVGEKEFFLISLRANLGGM